MGGYRGLGVPPFVVEGSKVVSLSRGIPPNDIWGHRSHGRLPVQVWLDKDAIALLDDLCTELDDEQAIVIGKALNANPAAPVSGPTGARARRGRGW